VIFRAHSANIVSFLVLNEGKVAVIAHSGPDIIGPVRGRRDHGRFLPRQAAAAI
jgi:hypothetical protein